ncbi:DUF7311 family protein [Natronolimnohabitans innermongolicus]|uniref:DUF7311 domain-containing protein n=1 Tax=Natronolimnohabitans innermongolicus JCM 12255 TaxID=1227499 RepID=L9WH57_9EURY|nr:hypothetical protein [Natronolimnohabitans innermongolicus]ELY48566.1 hypothetical protein C493_22071 [Natronolimnohabitans innermongolicus JCM 12255]
MIRYVLAAILAVAILAVAVPAVDRAASMNAERTIDASIADIDDAASSLTAHDEPTPGSHPDPKRIVTVSLPDRSLTTAGVDHVEIVPHDSGEFSTARYVLSDGTTREATIDERIVHREPDGDEPVELGGSGEQQLLLTLQTDADDDPVVVARQA